ncbi:MAG: DNA-deoxyinosine glycosylase [Puniceicoccales bacterium]|jgi:hypoxanthine-DNA glycosylase|nr:DNA-deoxyinosine glycosylase [Puniceicoccales bacterium]
MFRHEHPFAPIFDENSEVLILGSFPSVISRRENFYYAHPGNRFWKIMVYLTGTDPFPGNIEAKKDMLFRHQIALWDVVQSCTIEGSQDHRIGNVTPVDLGSFLERVPIKKIFTNGRKAHQLFHRFFAKYKDFDVKILPSTSAANAAFNFTKLAEKWRIILPFLNN